MSIISTCKGIAVQAIVGNKDWSTDIDQNQGAGYRTGFIAYRKR